MVQLRTMGMGSALTAALTPATANLLKGRAHPVRKCKATAAAATRMAAGPVNLRAALLKESALATAKALQVCS